MIKIAAEKEYISRHKTPMVKSLLDITIRRCTGGVKIRLKSPQIESLFKNFDPLPKFMERDWNGHRAYILSKGLELNSLYRQTLSTDGWGGTLVQPAHTDEPRYNCSMLRAEGLEKGVTFHIPGVYLNTIIAGWCEAMEEIAMVLYMTYLKPKGKVISIKISEVQDEGVEYSKTPENKLSGR